MPQPETYITKAIEDAIRIEIERIGAEEIAKAQAEIERRIKLKMAEIVLGVHKYYDMSRREGHLVITVKEFDK